MTAVPNIVIEASPTRAQRVREIRDACDAIVGVIIATGGSPATAYRVAGDIAYGLEDPAMRPKWRER